MIGGLIGGFIGGTFSVISQLPFIPGLILVASLYLVWRCFQGDCWFANCRGLSDPTLNPSNRVLDPSAGSINTSDGVLNTSDPDKLEGMAQPVSAKHKELRSKIGEIVKKNLGMSLKDFVNS